MKTVTVLYKFLDVTKRQVRFTPESSSELIGDYYIPKIIVGEPFDKAKMKVTLEIDHGGS